MSEARINRISNEKGDGGPSISGITNFSGLNYFVPPRGTTAERPSDCPPGSIRFNTDSAHLEYFDGLQWLEFEATNDELGVNGALGNRGVIASAYSPSILNTLEYITISTLGNALDFGDSTLARHALGSCSSSTRGVFGGGEKSNSPSPGTSFTNTIDYITISSTGDAIDFGDLNSSVRGYCRAFSSSTRGIFGGGVVPTLTNQIDYITIASTGDAKDFGDLNGVVQRQGTASSSVRGLFAGGRTSPTTSINGIDYITISTTGDAQDFGDLIGTNFQLSGCSNSTRGIFAGGFSPSTTTLINTIQFITISSLGNSQDFGDLSSNRGYTHSLSSSTRGVFSGGLNPTVINVIEYITIASTGNAVDFGDQITASGDGSACSNGHGGL